MDGIKIAVSDNICRIDESKEYLDTAIYIIADDIYFPCKDWDDLSLELLTMWSEHIIRNKEAKRADYSLYFMDGPYKLTVEQFNNELNIKGVYSSAGSKDIIVFEGKTTIVSISNEIYKAFCKIERIIYRSLGDSSCFGETINYYKSSLLKIIR